MGCYDKYNVLVIHSISFTKIKWRLLSLHAACYVGTNEITQIHKKTADFTAISREELVFWRANGVHIDISLNQPQCNGETSSCQRMRRSNISVCQCLNVLYCQFVCLPACCATCASTRHYYAGRSGVRPSVCPVGAYSTWLTRGSTRHSQRRLPWSITRTDTHLQQTPTSVPRNPSHATTRS